MVVLSAQGGVICCGICVLRIWYADFDEWYCYIPNSVSKLETIKV